MPPNLSRLRPLKMKRSPFGIGKLISRFVPDSKLWVMTGTSIVIREGSVAGGYDDAEDNTEHNTDTATDM